MPAETQGVIHDLGYRRYDGRRLGRGHTRWSLYQHGLRAAFGLGRGAKAKIFPWGVVGAMFLVAIVLTAIRAQTGDQVISYWELPGQISVLVVLFCAVVAPELVSKDLRAGVLPLYFSRPVSRWDYALAKLAALISSIFLLLAGPELLMFLGAAFSADGVGGVWSETVEYGKGLGVIAVIAVTFGSIALLVASLAGRRAVAAALIVAVFLITTPIYGVLMGLAFAGDAQTLQQLAGLVSPMTLVDGVGRWWFGGGAPSELSVGSFGPLYGVVTLAVLALATGGLLLRYRTVAR